MVDLSISGYGNSQDDKSVSPLTANQYLRNISNSKLSRHSQQMGSDSDYTPTRVFVRGNSSMASTPYTRVKRLDEEPMIISEEEIALAL